MNRSFTEYVGAPMAARPTMTNHFPTSSIGKPTSNRPNRPFSPHNAAAFSYTHMDHRLLDFSNFAAQVIKWSDTQQP
jgi:hypothetical protein